MINFLFWNIKRKPLQANLARLVERYNVDLLILAESEIPDEVLLDVVHQQTGKGFHATHSWCDRIRMYSLFSSAFLHPALETDRITIRYLAIPASQTILIAATHLPGKLDHSAESQIFECVELADKIQKAEQMVGHCRTVLIGDLNMNPFEAGMVSAKGLHAVMTRQIAERRSRVVQRVEYPFFYNPMWGRFGDQTEGPAGTWYANRSEQVTYFWNMFDQVLLRPDLLPFFDDASLKILTNDGGGALVSAKGFPDKRNASDHLPVMFSLNL